MRELFSRRRERENGELSDVYAYDFMPQVFRNQFCHILREFYRILREIVFETTEVDKIIEHQINNPFAKMKGLFKLPTLRYNSSLDDMMDYILKSTDKDCIDAVDFVLSAFNAISTRKSGIKDKTNRLIIEVNYWLKYNNLGYEFINDELIIKTNEVIHQQIVLPSFHLIHDTRFAGTNEEMRNAYEFRRNGDNEAAIVEANKAFESAMKSICDIKQYTYDSTYAANKLLGVLKGNNYFPAYLKSHLDAICASIESGLPTVRNKTAGHGQGAQPRSLPDEYVDYALHILSTNLVFLIGLLPK